MVKWDELLEQGWSTVWRFEEFRLDVTNQCLWHGAERVPLMPKPFAVLHYLVEHAGRLVTQDQLLAAIWPDAHVQPEVLRRYVLEIRRALGDQVEMPRFLETLPKRGYRFIPDVTFSDPENAVTPTVASPGRHGKRAIVTVTGILTVLLLAIGILWLRSGPRRLTANDTIVLADFTNTTGDPVFDGTLRQGLAVQLEQSPFLRVAAEEQIQQTLRLMKRPPDTKLTPDVGREVCLRTGGTVLLYGSIARIGSRYSLILRAVNCSNGEFLTSAQSQADDKNRVLDALGRASSDIRERLGESLATVQKFDIPLEQASTSSLEALRAYSLGHKALTGEGDSAAAIPFFRRAVKLDPAFAMAYVLLGDGYWNLGETTLASENIRKAYELRDGVSESERLRIETEYYSLVTNNLEGSPAGTGSLGANISKRSRAAEPAGECLQCSRTI